MISNQESLQLSPYMAIYDLVVPKDNMLRQINELVDFTFILEELKSKYCLVNGRNAIPPLREGCYKEGAKSKSYSVSIKSSEHKEQEAFQNSEDFKLKAKSRYKIEAKNSELKHRHGYDVATSAGLFSMQMRGALSIFTVNLKRILTLMKE